MARILDFYDVRWEYEPHTFPILWTLEGTVVESFSPDFFLPDLDLYLEMTTLRHVRIPRERAEEWESRLLDMALEFSREPRGGDTEYGLLISLFPTKRRKRARP